MKRLIDENIDASARQLLEAGRDVHPNPAKKAAFQAAVSMGGVALLTGAPKATGIGVKGAGWTGNLAKLGALIAVTASIGAAILSAPKSPKGTPPPAAPPVIAAPGIVPVPRDSPTDLGDGITTSPQGPPVPVEVHPARTTELSARPKRTGHGLRTAPEISAPSRDRDEPSRLRQEAELVDALRHAVQANDRHQSELLSARYWREFGTGQLVPEVRHLDAKWRRAP